MSENNTMSSIIIKSQLYGEITPEPHQIYRFEEGIVGFSHLKQFALLPYGDTELFVLQSFTEELSLLLLPAEMSGNTTGFHIDEQTVEQPGVQSEKDVVAFYILRFIDQKPFINLKAPILIVPDAHTGCQYVITDNSVSVREPLVLTGDGPC